jgi:NADPH:quinone reductase-like Zn-dependent oxidoreductase
MFPETEMKACVFTEFGPPEVLHLADVPRPAPRDNELLIRIKATPINFGDLLVRNFKAKTPRQFHMPFLFWLIGKFSFGFRKPRVAILGSEFSGVIEEAGKDVKKFKKNDPVFGYCGARMGAYGEYLRMPEKGVCAIKPSPLTFEEAAAVPYGAIMALNILKKMNLKSTHRILINGASGGIGSSLVQLAHSHYGAHVTGVCGARGLEYVKSLGADKVMDYRKVDFLQNGETYDFVIDILGKVSFSRCRPSLGKQGKLLFVSFKTRQVFQMLWTSLFSAKKVVCVLVNEKAADLIQIKELIEKGDVRAILDRSFPLEQAAEAHRYAESGQKMGNVVITIK